MFISFWSLLSLYGHYVSIFSWHVSFYSHLSTVCGNFVMFCVLTELYGFQREILTLCYDVQKCAESHWSVPGILVLCPLGPFTNPSVLPSPRDKLTLGYCVSL